jgi:hypothetical protein
MIFCNTLTPYSFYIMLTLKVIFLMDFWLNLEPLIIAYWIEGYVLLMCYRLFISLQLILFGETLIYSLGIAQVVIYVNSTMNVCWLVFLWKSKQTGNLTLVLYYCHLALFSYVWCIMPGRMHFKRLITTTKSTKNGHQKKLAKTLLDVISL